MSEPIVAVPRKSRRLRSGLRAGLGAIALVAVALALIDYVFRAPYRAEQRAASALVQLGGNVILVDDTQGWLRKCLGLDLFDMRVAAVIDLSHSRVTDADLVHLRAFDHFGALNLSDTEISNAGLEHLRPVVAYRFIDLSRTRITDTSSLFGNSALKQPSGLRLSGNRVANGAIFSGRTWCPLQELDLSETDANDQTLKKFPEGLGNLSKLDLSGTNVTDAGLDSLMRLEGLTSLDLTGTKVTAEGVARLKARWKGRLPLKVATGTTRLPIMHYGEISK